MLACLNLPPGQLALNMKSVFPGPPEGHCTRCQSPCLVWRRDPGAQVTRGVEMKPGNDLQE